MPDYDVPYLAGRPRAEPFYGRVVELARLLKGLRGGKRAMAAVMGGRGMGKTSLALRLKQEMESSARVHLIRHPERDPLNLLAQIGIGLGATIDPHLPTESMTAAVRAAREPVVLLIDEIENGLHPGTIGLLDNLRVAYEGLHGRLGIVVFGGTRLRELLVSDASPFLRTAEWVPLRGLSLDECARLAREPLSIDVPNEVIETIWRQAGGHPLLWQEILERAAEFGPGRLVDQIPEAIDAAMAEKFYPTLFPIWWENLRERGQGVLRRILRQKAPLRRASWPRALGDDCEAWVEVLETTGVVHCESGEVLPACTLFATWVEQSHPSPPDGVPVPARSWTAPHPFEDVVVDAIERWVRSTMECPTLTLKDDNQKKGNARLVPEQHFQITLWGELRQRELLAEAEPLSSMRGRTDVKIRWPAEPSRRTCVELKIWGRPGSDDLVGQVLGYTIPEDEFACVVLIDRQSRPLIEAYRPQLDGNADLRFIVEPEPGRSWFLTEHARASGKSIRVHHFLVQLPAD